jgi:ribosomal peptide maturation radical SAM protein 1
MTNQRTYKVALVAMPWSMRSQPSAALGALSAYLRRNVDVDLSCKYEYVEIGTRIGHGLYEALAVHQHELGELLYAPLLYPEKHDAVRDYLAEWSLEYMPTFRPSDYGMESWRELYDKLLPVFERRIDELCDELSDRDLVGMTTCYGQLFPNLVLARALKQRAPHVRTLLGGSTVSARVGPSLMREYAHCIDAIIQGEGERPLVELVRSLASGAALEDLGELPGLLIQTNLDRHAGGAQISEVSAMDDLPLPDFTEYAEVARRYHIMWSLPLEGSRGCWWDRIKRHGNPRASCYFCNLNVQWGGYREKSIDRVVAEVDRLTDHYHVNRVYFLDNIIRPHGISEFAGKLQGLNKDLDLFYEMRANVSAYEMLQLWEAGLRQVQIGIEALSTSFLKRMGKGTTLLQNLQAMRLCHELGIKHGGNLIIDFPTSIQEEVDETVRNIERYAIAYEPCRITTFRLSIDSTVDRLRDDFGVANVRNRDLFRRALPDAVFERVQLFDLSYDGTAQTADWSPVVAACDRWAEAHKKFDVPLLRYFDGGTFLRILDLRSRQQSPLLRGRSREIYLYCMEIRSFRQICERFDITTAAAEHKLREFLDRLLEQDLIAEERNKFLALAPAANPQAARRRILAAHAQKQQETSASTRARRTQALTVVAS